MPTPPVSIRSFAWPWLPVLVLCALGVRADTGSERLETFLATVQTLKSDFRQTVFDEDMNRLEEGAGVMYLQRPGRFRWHYSTPYPQEIVADGERVWIYDPELEQVTVKSLEQTLGDTPALLLSSDRPVEESFRVLDLGDLEGLAWVGLEPLSEDATFSQVRLGFDTETLASMELVDNFGQTTRLRFSGLQRNPELDPELFEFEPPSGTDVIDY